MLRSFALRKGGQKNYRPFLKCDVRNYITTYKDQYKTCVLCIYSKIKLNTQAYVLKTLLRMVSIATSVKFGYTLQLDSSFLFLRTNLKIIQKSFVEKVLEVTLFKGYGTIQPQKKKA